MNYLQDAIRPLYGPVHPDALADAQHTIVVVLKYASGAADVIDLQAIPGYEGFMKNQQSLLLFEFTQVRNVELVTGSTAGPGVLPLPLHLPSSSASRVFERVHAQFFTPKQMENVQS